MRSSLVLDISNCHTHSAIVDALTPLGLLLPFEIVDLEIKVNRHFIYPDFLLLVVASIKATEQTGMRFQITVSPNPAIKNYLCRVDFYKLLGIQIEEGFYRRNGYGKFTEITNYYFEDEDSFRNASDSIVGILRTQLSIDESVTKNLSFCLMEIMDNIRHSGQSNGWVVAQFYPENEEIRIMVCDSGKGIHTSFVNGTREEYHQFNEEDCLRHCIKKGVTSGDGMGNGLYFTSGFTKLNQGELIVYSGQHYLLKNSDGESVHPAPFFEGTFVYLKIKSNVSVVAGSFTDGHTTYIDDIDFLLEFEEPDETELW